MYFRKTALNSIIPCTDEAADFVRNLTIGEEVEVKAVRRRNIKFHRKMFAMLDYAFDCFTPQNVEVPQYLVQTGIVPEKNKERFRKDMIILAGYYDATIRVNGDVRLEAKSMSFASMDEDTFNDLYSKIIDVVIKHVLTNFSEEELKTTVDGLMEFA